MPINYLNAPVMKPDYAPYENFFSNMIKGYQTGQKHSLDQAQAKEKLSTDQMKNALLRKHGEDEKLAEIAYLKNKAATEGYGPALARAEVEQRLARAWADRNPYGEPGAAAVSPMDIPQDVIGTPFNKMSKNEQLYESKAMDQQLHKAQNMEATLPIISKLEAIQDENPNLWKSFSLILADPDNRGGVVNQFLKSNFVSEKDRTAIDLFSKYTGDLILKGGEGLGGQQRITDSLRSLIKQVKPDVRNTPEANKAVLNSIKETMSVGPAMARAYRWGKKNRVSIVDNPEAFRSFKSDVPIERREAEDISMDSSRAVLRDALNSAPPSDADIMATAKKYNITPEQVKQRLGIQ